MSPLELSAELERRGLIIDKIEGDPPEVYVRTPKYPTIRLRVGGDGIVRNDPDDHFPKSDRLPSQKIRNMRALRELACDVVGRELMAFGRKLAKLGWPLIAERSLYDLDGANEVWVGLSLAPRILVARILDREVQALALREEHRFLPADFPSHLEEPSEFERARVEKFLGTLRRDIALIDEERRRRPARPIEAYFDELRPRTEKKVVSLADAARGKPREPRWTDYFRRSRAGGSDKAIYRIVGTRARCMRYDGYIGGHAILDRVLELCEEFDFPRETDGSESPFHPSFYEDRIELLDGHIQIYAGKYLCPGAGIDQGAKVHGPLALRWLIKKLGCKQPRSIKGERRKPTPAELEELDRCPYVDLLDDGDWRMFEDE